MKVDLRARRSWRSTKSDLIGVLMLLAVVAVAIPLVAVLWSVIGRGAGVAFRDFPAFFTDEIPLVSRRAGPGMGPAILGTLLVTGGATLIAVPFGILGAIYLHEYGGKNKFAKAVRFMSTVMTGVPSIVMGLFVYIMWTMRFGYSAFGGSLALAFLMLPVVIGATEQMLRLVPNHLREASYALGATKSRTILAIVLPAALPGIVSGCLLAIARAAGETAPLLFAVGAANAFNTSLFDEANTALSVQIFGNATSSFVAAQDRAWGAAFTLVTLTFLVTLAARVITARFALKR
ncbi:MAG: phosphate ABC transporter permease PstA [Myxococcota bacterium]|nr:phosphate ABC transporter permease PstA [Deltaproteobacteria bacterium]MDQ3338429.1 phosphate ABC transporter permease PstA [Myxococcota bacterium]